MDKICGIVVRIRKNDDVEESRNKLIAMLEDMLGTEDGAAKKNLLEEKYGMKMTVELERSVDDMCNLSAVVEEKGINALVNTLRGLQVSNDIIISNLMKEFGVSEIEAKKYLY